MPYKPPVVPLSKTERITKVKGIPEINEENYILVGFRQATGADTDKRQTFNFTPFTRTYVEGSEYGVDTYNVPGKPIGERWAFDVYLTMTECDILDPAKTEDAPLFKFSEVNGLRRVAGSFEEFYKKFGALPDGIKIAIHDVCLECNPTWAGFDDEDEEGN